MIGKVVKKTALKNYMYTMNSGIRKLVIEDDFVQQPNCLEPYTITSNFVNGTDFDKTLMYYTYITKEK